MTTGPESHEHLPPPLARSRWFPFGHPAAPGTGQYRWVYLWGAPLRAMHWLAAICIVVLAATGFYIGRPYLFGPSENTSGYLMGYVRLVHFLAAGLLVVTGIVRVYWLFAGNQFERLPALFPVRPRDWVNFIAQLKYYLLIHPERAPHYLGHHPMQQMSYTGMYLVTVLAIVTGFTLYGQSNPGGFWFTLTQPVAPLLGGLQIVRFIHHVLVWVFILFAIVHVYLVLRNDILDRSGGLSSIVSGGHFVRSDLDYVDE
jgi:Ni/Fe-hydrogenase 1 B-type cytochrome subunit